MSTHTQLIEAHIAHLKHLAKPATARLILRSRHGYSAEESKSASLEVAAHVAQALHFYWDSRRVHDRVRPLLQYYCFLNFAAACILCYRPPGYEHYMTHGVSDRTHSLRQLSLGSTVVKCKTGAVPTFHSLFSSVPLPPSLTLRDLIIAITNVEVELNDAFKMYPDVMSAEPSVGQEGNEYWSQLQFDRQHATRGAPLPAKLRALPRESLERAMPFLAAEYRYTHGDSNHAVYRSLTVARAPDDPVLMALHHRYSFFAVNYGNVRPQWRFYPETHPLPVLSATILLSFVLSSVLRYRSRLAGALANYRLNLLLDVFVSEADATMMPAFRNLLYRENVRSNAIESL